MADETEQVAHTDQFSDAYEDYIARKRAAEEPTWGNTNTTPGLGDSGYLFTPANARLVDSPSGRTVPRVLPAHADAIWVEGPELSNHQRYTAEVWPLWRKSDPRKPPPYLTNFGIYYILALTLVGLVLIPLLLALDLLWHFFRRPELMRRYEEALADPSRHWAWTVRRTGWTYVTVPVGSYDLRRPELVPDQPGYCILEEVEVSKEAALEAANRAVARLSS